jgi:hypothetical protein
MEDYWGSHVKSWLESGLSKHKYCELHQIRFQDLKTWREKLLRKDRSQSSFLPVQVEQNNPLDSGLWIRNISGLKLQIDRNFDPETLQKVLKIFESC